MNENVVEKLEERHFMLIEQIKSISVNSLARLGSIILNSVIFFSIVPTLLFLGYMVNEKFFSYDLFSIGFFGISSFYGVIAFFMILFSLFFTLWEFFVTEYVIEADKQKKEENNHQSLFFYIKNNFKRDNKTVVNIVFSLIVNLFFIGLGIYTNESIFWFLIGICSLITIHFAIVVYANGLTVLYSLFLIFGALVFAGITNLSYTASMVKFGMNSFGVGGGQPVIIKTIDKNQTIITGNLILLSPETVFVSTKNQDNYFVHIINRSSNIDIIINNKKEIQVK